MPALDERDVTPPQPLPHSFLKRLAEVDQVLVSSRGPTGQGRVRMWFAISPDGHVYLLTPSFSVKAQRWLEDPWVRLTIPGAGSSLVGQVKRMGAAAVERDGRLLVSAFAMSGATTSEALLWMLESGSHLLLRVDAAP